MPCKDEVLSADDFLNKKGTNSHLSFLRLVNNLEFLSPMGSFTTVSQCKLSKEKSFFGVLHQVLAFHPVETNLKSP